MMAATMLAATPAWAQDDAAAIAAAQARKAAAEQAAKDEDATIARLLAQRQQRLEAELAATKADLAARAAASPAAAPGVADKPADPVATAAATAAAETVDRLSQRGLLNADRNSQKFGGVDFGIGLAFTYDVGENDRIREAEVVNGFIRVKEQRNQDAGFVLDLHYFFTPDRKFLGLSNAAGVGKPGDANYTPEKSEWGIGPFIAVRPGSDEVIDAIGGGLMIGLKRPALAGSTATGNDSFNIGIGVMYDLGVQILGDGLKANATLPAGDTLRYRKTSQTGLLLMSSYSF